MQQKERYDDTPPTRGGTGSTEDALGQLRARADHFLAAGDEAINRALAGSDSEMFLKANRQQGGE